MDSSYSESDWDSASDEERSVLYEEDGFSDGDVSDSEEDELGAIFPYRFEPYLSEEGEDNEEEEEADAVPVDIDRLQNVEW